MKTSILNKSDVVNAVKDALQTERQKKQQKRAKRLALFGFLGGALGVGILTLFAWQRFMHVPNNQR